MAAIERKQSNGEGLGWRSLPRWFRWLAVAMLVLGIFFRFYNLDRKVYWLDETHTSMRITGHTRIEFTEEIFTGEVVTAEMLQQYQRLQPDKGWDDTLNALKGNAEHTPLYFLTARLWVEFFGYSVTVMRSLPALLSVLVLPALFWFCRELFESTAPGWVAMTIFAVSPLHILYAQEARPYTLWTLTILASSAMLLQAVRRGQKRDWWLYAATVAIGLYTQLLFGLVAIAHALFIAIHEQLFTKRTLTANLKNYLLATIAALAAFLPWAIVFFANLEQVQTATASLNQAKDYSRLVNQWSLNMSRVLVDGELGSVNFLLILLAAFALYYTFRNAPKQAGILLLSLAGVSFLTLAVPDVVVGGQRSTRIRYLFPFYISIQIALAYLFATQALWAKRWGQRAWRVLLIALLTASIWACATSSQAEVWWIKSNPRSGYYPVVSSIINQSENPLIISDGPPVDMLAFSYRLRPDVSLQLVTDARSLDIAPGYFPIYALNPTPVMLRVLRRQGYTPIPIFVDLGDDDRNGDRLWLVRPPC